MAAIKAVLNQFDMLNHIVGMLRNIVLDKNMSSRISLKSFVVDFFGMILHEGFTNPGVSAESVAQRVLGAGNHLALKGRVAIITGASGGLGFEHARVLMKYGCHVVFAVRDAKKANGLLSELAKKEQLSGAYTVMSLDLNDLTTVKPFVENFLALNLPLNYLVNNAGVMTPKTFTASVQGFECQFATNHLAHFLLTELLMPKLNETRKNTGEARVVILSSVGSSLCKSLDLDQYIPPPAALYNGPAEYGTSKALNIFHCRELQKRCGEEGIACCAVHPGVIHTGLNREGNPDSTVLYDSILFKWMHKDITQGAATQVYCTLSSDVSKQIEAGTCLWYNCAPQRAAGIAAPGVRDDLCSTLWEISEGLVKPFR